MLKISHEANTRTLLSHGIFTDRWILHLYILFVLIPKSKGLEGFEGVLTCRGFNLDSLGFRIKTNRMLQYISARDSYIYL